MRSDAADLLGTARALATDAAGARVVEAWQARGIPSLLLKGPTTAEWLYPGDPRPYADIDLLVPPARVHEAAEALTELGFAPEPEFVSPHAHPWTGPDGATIDLHVTIWGPSRDAAFVWAELQHWATPYQLGRVQALALDLPARALHVVLHAAQHREEPRNPADLQRLLEVATREQWREAQRLADRLWALLPMAQGLALEPAGRALIAELPLVRAAALAEETGAPLAVGFARIAAASGLRAKATVLAQSLAAEPDPSSPDPERRPRGPARRLGRLAWLIRRAPRTAVAVWRARRRAP